MAVFDRDRGFEPGPANLVTDVLWTPASPYMQPLQYVLKSRFGISSRT